MEAAVAAQHAWEAHAAAKAVLFEAEERLGEAEAAAALQNLDAALPGKAAARHAVTRPSSSLSPVRPFSVLSLHSCICQCCGSFGMSGVQLDHVCCKIICG